MSGQNSFRAHGTLENQSSVAFCSVPSLTLNELQRGLALDRGWVGGWGEGVESFSEELPSPRPCTCRLFVDVISML